MRNTFRPEPRSNDGGEKQFRPGPGPKPGPDDEGEKQFGPGPGPNVGDEKHF